MTKVSLRKGSKVFCAGFGVGRVEEYYAHRTASGAEGYVVIYFPQFDLRSKLLLSASATWERLRAPSGPAQMNRVLNELALPSERLPGMWTQRKELLQEKLKSDDLRVIAAVVRNLNALPEWGCTASSNDFAQLEKAKNILVSELQNAYSLSWIEAALLVEKTVRELRVQLPRKRGRKPKGWTPADDIRFAEQPGLLAVT